MLDKEFRYLNAAVCRTFENENYTLEVKKRQNMHQIKRSISWEGSIGYYSMDQYI